MHPLKKLIFCTLILLIYPLLPKAQEIAPSVSPPFLQYTNSTWVDSVFQSLTQEERIAQLIMVAAYSNRDEAHKREILNLIKNQKIGGLIFFQGGPVRQARLTNAYQEASRVPLLIAMDAEWGIAMRLDSTARFPYQMTLGAIQDNDLIYQMGKEIARQSKRLGMHFNFAPVVDVNNNAKNPVINFRSFGEDKYNVAQKGIAYMHGMQDGGLLSTAKHFPGHGDTDTDSHHALPIIKHSRERLDSLEIYPFRKIIEAGIGGVMVAHLSIPALDDTENTPSTLSEPIVTGLLKDELGFKGLTVTDAMNMKGVTQGNTPGTVDMKAILAGNDLLEFTEDVPKAIAEIKKAIDAGKISQEEIDNRCRKVLAAKQWVGLDQYKPIELAGLVNEMTTPTTKLLNRKLTEASLTVLRNDKNLLPLQRLDTLKVASISLGASSQTDFQKMLSHYTQVDHFYLSEKSTQTHVVRNKLKDYNLVIVGVHDTGRFPYNRIGLSDELNNFIGELATSDKAIFAVFKNPYVLDKLKNIHEAKGLVITHQDSQDAEELAAQLIFGGISASGTLPVTANSTFKAGDGLEVKGNIRFNYTLPEDAGMNSEILYAGIDSLVQDAIDAKAIPGCQVLVAKDRKVVFYKAYGLHVYADTIPVEKTDLYDMASVTKISTGLPSLMKLHDEGKFDVDASLDDYLPKYKNSNKADIPFRDLLTHQGRLTAWIPFWQHTLRKNGSFRWFTFKEDSSQRFPVKVADNLYLNRNYHKKLYKAIRKSPLLPEQKYVYSDLSFYLYPKVVETITGEDFITYLNETFYKPLGASTLTYNPYQKFPMEDIVPTESDFLFRRVTIHGRVHDEGAGMLDGISGHAGLFGNANDLAKLIQMYLQKGEYGGQRYINEATLEEFTRYQFPEMSRRGIGFDKPNVEYVENGNTAKDASPASFGHTGFTGTFAWADPAHNLVYIFLSNRVHPTRENSRLYQLNTRTKIQQVLYDAIDDSVAGIGKNHGK